MLFVLWSSPQCGFCCLHLRGVISTSLLLGSVSTAQHLHDLRACWKWGGSQAHPRPAGSELHFHKLRGDSCRHWSLRNIRFTFFSLLHFLKLVIGAGHLIRFRFDFFHQDYVIDGDCSSIRRHIVPGCLSVMMSADVDHPCLNPFIH